MEAAPSATFDTVRELAATLPEVSEKLCHGTPALYVRNKLMARLREDGETLAIKTEFTEREFWMEIKPEAFFVTDHYLGYPMMLVRLPVVQLDDLQTLVKQAWRIVAPKRLAETLDI